MSRVTLSQSQNSQTNLRSGFTLVELLVVVGIILVIAGMTAFFMPGFEVRERAHAGSARLQNWLTIAKQRALLDRAPRGVRFFVDKVNTQFITQAQYIEQPEDYSGGEIISDPQDPSKLSVTGDDLTGGFPSDQSLWPIQVGDYLQVNNSGLMHQISAMQPQQGQSSLIQLFSPLPYPITIPSKNYRIVRQPRLQGEELLLMPFSVGIDLKVNQDYQKNLPFNKDGSLDIVFAPSGAVIGNVVSDKMVFWIRESSNTNDIFQGYPSLIVLYTRSGLAASVEIDKDNPANPFTKIP